MKIRIRQQLAAALMIGAAGPSLAEPFVLRVLAQESIPPKWLPRNGPPQGLCPDILAAIEKVAPQLRFSGTGEIRSVPHIESGLESGKVHAACALLDTPRRRQIAHLVGKPLYLVRHRLAAAAGDKAVINNFGDLVKLGALVNTPRGAAYSDQLRALGVAVDDSTGDNVVNLRKVLAGHGRFTYMNELSLGWIIRSEGMAATVRVLPTVLKEEPIYFWVSRKADPAAVAIVDQALTKLAANGELARIYERWWNAR